MKKIKIIVLLILCIFLIDVKADVDPAVILTHEVMVTNQSGTECYSNKEKTGKIIPYGTTLSVSYDIQGNFIKVENSNYSCDVKYVDVSSKTQKFDMKSQNVQEIEPLKAIILAKGGLSLRIGPSVTYSKIVTIPEYTQVTLKYSAGTYWYYTEYNGQSGWITSIDGYIGFNDNKVLCNYEDTLIYDSNQNTVVGKIPADTEITDYVALRAYRPDEFRYFVVYKGVKGYVKDMLYKTKETGKIYLNKEYEVVDSTGKLLRKLGANQELEYNMKGEGTIFYVPSKNTLLTLYDNDFKYVKEVELSVKKSGYIGEGLFGENKTNSSEEKPSDNPENPPVEKDNKLSTQEIIIFAVIFAILVSLILAIIMKFKKAKKNNG